MRPSTPVLVPAGVAPLAGAHDLGADLRVVHARVGVVDAAAAARLAEHRPAPARGEHPVVQPVAGVPEVRGGALPLAGAEAVERDREVVDAET
jgi:hypothetical protein